MNIILAEDSGLIRAGMKEVLALAGHNTIAEASDADQLRDLVTRGTIPDLVITDVRMPPDNTDDGLRAAVALRRGHPQLPIMVVSAYVSGPYVHTLLADTDGGAVGYLLKDRISRIEDFLAAIEVVASGGVVIDPDVVSHAFSANLGGPLQRLTPREHEVLELMGQGLSNGQIEARLFLSKAAVAKHVSSIFLKLDLPPERENRRVRAVLAWLEHSRNG